MTISITPKEFYNTVLSALIDRYGGTITDFAMINSTYDDIPVENLTTIDRVDLYGEDSDGRHPYDTHFADGHIQEQEGFVEICERRRLKSGGQDD